MPPRPARELAEGLGRNRRSGLRRDPHPHACCAGWTRCANPLRPLRMPAQPDIWRALRASLSSASCRPCSSSPFSWRRSAMTTPSTSISSGRAAGTCSTVSRRIRRRLRLASASDALGPHGIQRVFRFPYPAGAAVAMVPFGALPFDVAAGVLTVLLVAATMASLWLLGVRDWRCHGVAFPRSSCSGRSASAPSRRCWCSRWRSRGGIATASGSPAGARRRDRAEAVPLAGRDLAGRDAAVRRGGLGRRRRRGRHARSVARDRLRRPSPSIPTSSASSRTSWPSAGTRLRLAAASGRAAPASCCQRSPPAALGGVLRRSGTRRRPEGFLPHDRCGRPRDADRLAPLLHAAPGSHRALAATTRRGLAPAACLLGDAVPGDGRRPLAHRARDRSIGDHARGSDLHPGDGRASLPDLGVCVTTRPALVGIERARATGRLSLLC